MKNTLWFVAGAMLVVVLLLLAGGDSSSTPSQSTSTTEIQSLAELVFGPSAEVTAFRELGATNRNADNNAYNLQLEQEKTDRQRNALYFSGFLVVVGALLGGVYIYRKYAPVPVIPSPEPKLLIVQRDPQGDIWAFNPETQHRCRLVTQERYVQLTDNRSRSLY